FSMVGTSVQARHTSFQSAFQAVSGRDVMLLISDLASIELISGFQVPGDWVMPITSSSLARAGAASAESARSTKRIRRIMPAAPSHDISWLSPPQHGPRRRRAAAVVGRPLLGRLEEGARLGDALLLERLVLFRALQGAPPRGG